MFKYIQHRNILKGQSSTFTHYIYIQESVHLSRFALFGIVISHTTVMTKMYFNGHKYSPY